jgi:hypothetical protein
VVKIDVCKLTSLANARILDERWYTCEKRKGDKLLCVTKLDALRIYCIGGYIIRWSEVWDLRFVGLDLTFSNPEKTDGPVETVQLRT